MSRKRKATVSRSFRFPSVGASLRSGEYELEVEVCVPLDHLTLESWRRFVLLHLDPLQSAAGVAPRVTAPLNELERAIASGPRSGPRRVAEKMLAEPMVHQLMRADGVSESEVRQLYGVPSDRAVSPGQPRSRLPETPQSSAEREAVQAAENEGMPVRRRL